MGIFTRYVAMMMVFEAVSPDAIVMEQKLDILFNILNVGSETIDAESLQIICMMYAKGMIPAVEADGSKDDIAAQKRRVGEFAGKLLDKITRYDDEIDRAEFKSLVQNSPEMTDMLEHSVTEVVLTDRSKITPR